MRKTDTHSFILELKLLTSERDERFLSRCFYHAANIHNCVVKHCRKQLAKLRLDPEYKRLLKEYISLKDDPSGRKDTAGKLSAIISTYGLTEYSLHKYVKRKQIPVSRYIGSTVAQKIATDVRRGVEAVLYKDGETLRYARYTGITSFEGKTNTANIVYGNNRLRIGKHSIAVRPAETEYERTSLGHRVKYCRVIRKVIGTSYHYYVQLVLEGDSPLKHPAGFGRAGLDIGTSTVAFVSASSCKFKVIGAGLTPLEREKARILRAMDRSRRAANPGNYKPDGTIRKSRKIWVYSNNYKRLRMRYAGLCRKYAADLKQEQEILSNSLTVEANHIYVETMNFKALQKRSKETEVKADGRFKSKKRFGRSLQVRAPAAFLSILSRKLARAGGELIKVNTRTFKASQYNHVTDSYEKKSLSQRYNIIEGKRIQRDLYSAFLLKNSNNTYDHADRESCILDYPSFLVKHDACVKSIRASGARIPTSFGTA